MNLDDFPAYCRFLETQLVLSIQDCSSTTREWRLLDALLERLQERQYFDEE